MNNADIVEQLERMCGKVVILKNGWIGFMYRHMKFVNIPDPYSDTIKMVVPYITKKGKYNQDSLEKAINDANREVKYIKLFFQKNGSVSMRYDYKIIGGVTAAAIVKHMLETMYMASEYFMFKLQTL